MTVRICFCTAPDHTASHTLAHKWVEKKWAACVNIIPKIQSIYRYNGKIENDNESLMIIKTTDEGANKIKENLDKDHPYDCPEWIELTSHDVSDSYLKWLIKNSL